LGSRFLIGRLITYMLVVWFGITFIFVIPRLLPINPVEAMLGRILSQGAYMQEEQVQALRAALSDAFGVEGSWIQQYVCTGPSFRRISAPRWPCTRRRSAT
jgi:peptide/nickel transport system permease protein